MRKAMENDQIQHSKMKSSYGRTKYWETTIQNRSFIPCDICSPFILAFAVSKSTMRCLSKVLTWTRTIKVLSKQHLKETQLRPARRSKKEKQIYSAKNVCHWWSPLSSLLLQNVDCLRTWINAKKWSFLCRLYWKPEIRGLVQKTENGCQ